MRARRCLDDDEIQSLALGALSEEQAGPMLAHVGDCDECRTLVATVARRTVRPVGAAESHSQPHVAPTPLLAGGEIVDRYVIERPIGQGGMGVVYAAHDPQLERRVALKLVRTDRARSPQLRERLVREARAMARVSHPNVLTVYDAGIVEDQVFIAMEFVEGVTLAEWLRAEPQSWRDSIAVFLEAGRGLVAAHAVGIVHRDFKPDNVLVGKDGRGRVSDFGLAIEAEATPMTSPSTDADTPRSGPSARLTGDGRLVGTPAYMAPEQSDGKSVDARADQYAFCIALHEALTGVRPAARHEPERPRLLFDGARARRLPWRLRRAVVRGLSPSPADRFDSMESLLVEIERGSARRRGRAVAPLALTIAAIAGTAGAAFAHRPAQHEDARAFARSERRLTYASGCEEYPSFVGRSGLLVFDGEADDTQQIFTLDTASGATHQLTVGPMGHRAPLVSPDGRRVAYEEQLEGSRAIVLRSLDRSSTEVRTLGAGSTSGGSWLDDHRLVVLGASGTVLALDVDAPGATPQPLYEDPEHHRIGHTSAFSDGTLVVEWWAPPSGLAIGLLSPQGTSLLVDRMPYTDGTLRVGPAQDAVYFVRRAGAANELVRVPRRGGAQRVVEGGIVPARGLTISPDGARLAFSTCASHAQLVRIDDGPKPRELFRSQPWSDTAPEPIGPHRLLFASDRSGHDQLYVAEVDGGEPRPISGLDVEQGTPSTDGRWIAYAAHDPGGIWIAPVEGGAAPRRLTDGAHDDSPAFSRDGGTVYFSREETIFAVARDGGAPRSLGGPGRDPVTSPTDDRVFFLQRLPQPGSARVMVIDATARVSPVDVSIPVGNDWALTVSPDGRKLAMVHEGYEILEVPLDGSGPAHVRTRMSRWVSSLHYTFDGTALWASLESLDGDLWVADGQFP